ncbi:MAG: SpoIIE family protein phosphatase [Phycisphaeraceae bacterium]
MPTTAETTDALEIRDEHGGKVRHSLDGQPLVIGRSSEADIKLATPAVSRRHATLLRDPFQRWWIHDLGSHNGTLINGQRITEETVLHPDDTVQIGEFTLQLIAGAPRAEPAAAPGEVTSPIQTHDDAGAVSALHQVEPAHVATEHLSKLADFGQELIGTGNSDQRLHALCRLVIGEDFHGQAATVLRLEKQTDLSKPQMLCPVEPRERESAEPPHISRTLLRAVLDSAEPMMATNSGAAGGAVELSVAQDVMPMAAIACPLRSDDHAMDVLYATLPPEYATGEWLALVALAVRQYEQAELAWAGRRQAEILAAIERELDQARKIQMRLVPRPRQIEHLDTAIVFEPCRWVGGDYADILPTRDGRVLVTVADVCGKGTQAALTTASIHTMVHASVRAGTPLVEMMRNLNEHLLETLPDSSFATMACLVIEPGTGNIECVNAGHPPALVVNERGELRHMQEGENLPLGIAPVEPEGQDDQLEPGHWLALFSDGLTELADARGRMLGIDGLGEHFANACRESSAQQATEHLLAKANEIRGDRMAADDWTLLIARRT